MCGLAGLARLHGRPLDDAADETLDRMARSVAHRGPDETVVRRDGPVGLAFTRLSLVDPEGGGQPLESTDGSAVLIANGEVYNHRALAASLPAHVRMRTRSDCEVLVHLYRERGLRFFDDVHGMVSIVIWDRREQRLLLVRDRFAIKPLFWVRIGDQVAFSSEIKALLGVPGCPRALDWGQALSDQALSGQPVFTDEPPVSWFTGIEQVPAGTIVEIDLRTGAARSHRYWSLDIGGAGQDAPSDEEYARRYGELLAESVQDCLMADVEIGLFLSGGVDSAAVAALAARAGAGLHTFTALSGATALNGDAEYAHLTARGLGLPNHQVVFDARRVPSVAEWERLLWLLEMPQCGPEQFYKFELHRYVKAVRPGIKAMLLGAAADEYAGGYTAMFSGGAGWPGFLAAARGLGRARDLRRRPGLAAWWDGTQPALLTDAVVDAFAGPTEDPYEAFVRWKARDVVQYNCWHEDRTAGGNGIEARVPFLDHRLVELSASVPPARRERLLWDKRIVRDAVRDVLPAVIAEREKVPFFHGEGVRYAHRTFIAMLAQDGAELVERACASPTGQLFLDRDAMLGHLAQLRRDPAAGHVETLLRLVNLGLLDAMVADLPPPPVTTRFATVPAARPVADWTAERAEILELTLPRVPVGPADVPRLGDGVELLAPVAEEDGAVCYVAVDGQIEYVVTAEDDAAWLRFLRGVDGRRSVAKLLADSGDELDDVREVLLDAVEYGVLALAGTARPVPGPEG